MSETFNQRRMERCLKIANAIVDNWQRTNSFTYTVRATQPIEGVGLDELRTHYFAVGVGDNLTELPFTDLLVVFSMIEQQTAALRDALKKRPNKSKKDFRIRYKVTTDWPDEEAIRLLSQIQIQMPDGTGRLLRFEEKRHPPPDSEDDPQT